MKRLLCTVLAWLCLSPLALATTVGPTITGTGADNSGAGTTAWTNATNITANDSSFATCAQSTSGNNPLFSHYLKATNFGFSIPAGATINGIQVDISRKLSIGGSSIQDGVIKLVDGSGTVVGNDKGANTTNWPTTEAVASYGSSSDVWGTSLTDTDINSSSFGVVMQVQQKTNFATSTANVNYIQITVTYTAAGATTQQTMTMMGCGS